MTSSSTALISIIIPCYNAAPWLHRCLDSVLAQTYKNWEALLINDGSTDTTAEILEEYAERDARFRVFHQENTGPSAARNVGIQRMRGKWMTWMDADDTILPTHLATLEAATHDGSQYVLQKVLTINENGSQEILNGVLPTQSYSKEATKQLISYIMSSGLRNLFSREVLHQHHLALHPELGYAEDMVFYLEYLALVDKISIVGKATYEYRIRQTATAQHNSLAAPSNELQLYNHMRHAMFQLLGDAAVQFTSLTGYFRRIITSLYHQDPLETRKKRIAFLRTLKVPPLEPQHTLLYHHIALLLYKLRCYALWDSFNMFCYHSRLW